ncbi:hypothetical protein [Exiguobacterium undae]|uniref:hypothetical protein n=1 Tax=Exiguobacterium undae TaxID=169177 RepID=UPI00047DE2C8|nr:hypothetical protein [Exiguobacterium undae]
MKKIKDWWIKITSASVLWIVIPVSLAIIITTLYFIWPINFKDELSVKIIQVSITALAATVGIGTVINSSKSMELTKKKDQREQSAHIMLLSYTGQVGLSAPMYDDHIKYRLPKMKINPINRTHADKNLFLVNEEATELKNRETLLEYAYSLSSKRVNFDKESEKTLKLMNTGKGASVNVEIIFSISNIDELNNYSMKFPSQHIESDTDHVAYSINIEKSGERYEISYQDARLSNLFEQNLLTNEEVDSEKAFNYLVDKEYGTLFKEVIMPGENSEILIPHPFYMLCKHYIVVQAIKNKYGNNPLYRNEYDNILNTHFIKPIGEIKISFMDENLIRTGSYDPDSRQELIYSLELKDTRFEIQKNGYIGFYLEANLKEPQRTQKKRAYR